MFLITYLGLVHDHEVADDVDLDLALDLDRVMVQGDLKKKLFDENVPNPLILTSLLWVFLMKNKTVQPTKVRAMIIDLNKFL